MLIGIADDTSAVTRDDVRRRRADVDAVDDRSAGRRPLESCDNPYEGRLPGAARPEHDAELAALDREREPSKRRDAALLRGVNHEHLVEVDERGHPSPPILPGPRGSENARRVVSATSAAADAANARAATTSTSGSTVVASGGSGAVARAVTETTRVTRNARRIAPTTPTEHAHRGGERRARGDDPPQQRGGRALGFEVDQLPSVVAEVGADREDEAPDCEHERGERSGAEREERAVTERISPGIGLELGP